MPNEGDPTNPTHLPDVRHSNGLPVSLMAEFIGGRQGVDDAPDFDDIVTWPGDGKES